MNRLYEVLSSSGVVAPALLECAADRKAQFAGSLDTHLLELGAVDGRTLDDAISHVLDLPAVTADGLDFSGERPRAQMPAELQAHRHIAALAQVESTLWVAVHPDIDRNELLRLRGQFPQVEFASTSAVGFEKVNADGHGQELSPGSSALYQRYLQALRNLPRFESEAQAKVQPGFQAELQPVSPELQGDLLEALAARRREMQALRRRDAIIRCLQESAHLISGRSLLFRVREDSLFGLEGPGSIPDKGNIELPISDQLSSTLHRNIPMMRCHDLDLRLAVGLEQAMPCMLIPVKVKHRTVLALYIDRAGEDFDSQERTATAQLCNVAGNSLHKIILDQHQQQRGATSAGTAVALLSQAEQAPTIESSSPAQASRAEALPQIMNQGAAQPSDPAPAQGQNQGSTQVQSAAPERDSADAQTEPHEGESGESVLNSAVSAVSAAGEALKSAAQDDAPALDKTPSTQAAKAFGAANPEADAAAQNQDQEQEQEPADAQAQQASAEVEAPEHPPEIELELEQKTPLKGEPLVDPAMVAAAQAQSDGPAQATDDSSSASPNANPVNPSAEESPRPEMMPQFWDPKAGASAGEAATASESAANASKSLDEAIANEDVEYFLQLGQPAVNALAARLPGPLDDPQSLDPDAVNEASAVGPVARLMIQLGDKGVMALLDRTRAGNEEQRYLAALTFQELRDPRAINSLCTLCFDSSAKVRRIAARVLETYRDHAAFEKACAQIRENISHPDPQRRSFAISTAGVLRDSLAVSEVISALDEKQSDMQLVALEALCSITGQQLGLDSASWRQWWLSHRAQHRLEWVASALDHADPRMQQWACDELARLTNFNVEEQIPGTTPADAQDPNVIKQQWQNWWRKHQPQRPPGPRPVPSPNAPSARA